jgi:hypothetical protein
MEKLCFGTKAETLESIRKRLTQARCAPLMKFSVAEWKANPSEVAVRAKACFGSKQVIVRSSAKSEDSQSASHAGAYLSLPQIDPSNQVELLDAIRRVVSSYGRESPDDQFIVQEQLQNVCMSGVIFTRDIDTLAPYYVINYDDQSQSTSSVTSGAGTQLKTYIRFRASAKEPQSFQLKQAIAAAQELEQLFQNDSLDIEFAVTSGSEFYILQVRPIVLLNKPAAPDLALMQDCLHKVHRKMLKLNAPHPGLHGKRAIYSVMTDWNPAEIIGERPRTLALTLYKELVTDSIWAYQRNNYGYKDLRSFPLLFSFLGLPYIDVRVSFNSFVPRALDSALSDKLVDYYIGQLLESPTDHDKVEFNILFSCYYLNLPQRLKKLLNFGFSELELDRIKFALLSLTNNIISQRDGLYLSDLKKVEYLRMRFDEIVSSDLSTIDKIYWIIEDCKRYGTLPFAGLARAGFIAMQFLRSFVDLGIISEQERNLYLGSLNTVAKQLTSDHQLLAAGRLSKEAFLEKYGHLRPGTYDILSPTYREAFECYFKELPPAQAHTEATPAFEFSASQKAALRHALTENGILCQLDELLLFIKQGIEGREYSKFIFTRSLSHALTLLQELGARVDLSREQISFLDIKTVLDLYANLTPENLRDTLLKNSENNRASYQVTKVTKLPQLITDPGHLYDFHLSAVEPNFITQKRVTKILVTEEDFGEVELNDKIVFIASADPGYDWLFSRNIAGLVTMYGGANSHMAIRCAELGIAAVIGCGEKNFSCWSKAKMLDIDCTNKQVAILR